MSNSRLILSLIIILSLVFLLLGYIQYTIRLNRKNRVLYEKIRRAQQADSQANKIFERVPEDTLTKEQILFRELNKLFTDKLSFTDPKLCRKELADMLGTNVTYLATAIKESTKGMTVSEYINKMRLLYAGNMLIEAPQQPVDAVGEDAGFNSRSTYFRLFRDYYGMSPAEFRQISKQTTKKV